MSVIVSDRVRFCRFIDGRPYRGLIIAIEAALHPNKSCFSRTFNAYGPPTCAPNISKAGVRGVPLLTLCRNGVQRELREGNAPALFVADFDEQCL